MSSLRWGALLFTNHKSEGNIRVICDYLTNWSKAQGYYSEVSLYVVELDTIFLLGVIWVTVFILS